MLILTVIVIYVGPLLFSASCICKKIKQTAQQVSCGNKFCKEENQKILGIQKPLNPESTFDRC